MHVESKEIFSLKSTHHFSIKNAKTRPHQALPTDLQKLRLGWFQLLWCMKREDMQKVHLCKQYTGKTVIVNKIDCTCHPLGEVIPKWKPPDPVSSDSPRLMQLLPECARVAEHPRRSPTQCYSNCS